MSIGVMHLSELLEEALEDEDSRESIWPQDHNPFSEATTCCRETLSLPRIVLMNLVQG